MKTYSLILAFLLLSFSAACAQTVPPVVSANKVDTLVTFDREKFDPKRDAVADLNAAITRASAGHKRIMLDVGGEWCVWCIHMDKFFFLHPELAKIKDENYVWVKINMSPQNENKTFLAGYPEAKGYPHLFVLDETGKLVQSQDTSLLENGKTYDLVKFTEFLTKYAPVKEIK